MERTISNALSFDEIKSFEEQEKEVDKAALKAFEDIFVKHSMHTKLGAGLLHRHETLEDGTVMFHKLQLCESDCLRPQGAFEH